ncbi:MAG: cyclase family protein [Flavobacteriaceae bacterium]|nr:cyclase family protein [Flavobacteriaceae bacterium]
MQASITYRSKKYTIDLNTPLDISITMRHGFENVNAWYVDAPSIEPHRNGDFIGSVSQGSSTNFNDIRFNPHAHVTHTECLGHITEGFHSINTGLQRYFWLAELITVAPEKQASDFVISKKQLQYALGNRKREAVIIRTIPNLPDKKTRQYAHSNPPYLLKDAAVWLREKGVEHLLVDLPSVDKEKDDGALLAHKAFWNTEGAARTNATITEFIFADNTIEDGTYVLNLQTAPFENDATPSRPVLYKPLHL